MRPPPFVSVASISLVASLLACSCRPDAPADPGVVAAPAALAPAEDEDAVPGGPVDFSDFDFDVDAPDERGPPPTLVGVDGVSASTVEALAPFLETRQARLAAVRGDGGQILIHTRSELTTQLHAVDAPGEVPRPLTSGKDGVQQASYVPGRSGTIVFRRDHDGNEVHQLYTLDVAKGTTRRLSNGRHRHGQFRILGTQPLRLGLTANLRSNGDADLVTMVAPDFEPEIIRELSGTNVLIGRADEAGTLLVRQFWSTERSQIVRLTPGEAGLQVIPDEATPVGTYVDARFDATPGASGPTLRFTSDLGGEWVQLLARTPDGAVQLLSHGDRWDVEGFASLGERGVVYVLNEDGYSRLYLREPEAPEGPRRLELPDGVVSGLRRLGPTSVIFTLVTATTPADVYSFDVESESLTRWTYRGESEMEGTRVAPLSVAISTADELEVPALVYQSAIEGPSPVLLWMHGGPEEQSRPEFNPIIQYFAQHGVTVIAPNIRGSDGYGRTWRRRDDGVARGGAIEDVGAILEWIAEREDLDEGRVGIYGGSYGGYMTLAALTTYPERFAAGCDLVGISHIPRFLENTAVDRRALRREEYGDERDPQVRAVLEELSPLNRADQITAPLFVAHGANDPRVPVAEARQIFEAVSAPGGSPWLMVANDEGHSMKKRDNRDLFYGLMVDFFTRHLLERESGPAGDPVMAPTTPP